MQIEEKNLAGEKFASEEDILSLRELEKTQIKKTLDFTGWNRNRSAELLGIHRNTLRLKIEEYGLDKPL